LENLRTFNNEWNLIIYLNLKDFINRAEKLGKYIDLIDKSCNAIQTLCQVTDSVIMAKNRLATIVEYQSQIEDLLGYQESENTHDKLAKLAHTRVKRGWFNFIGSVHKTLYGTLNEEDGEYYNTQIDKLFNDTTHLATLLANQTHIIQSILGTHETELANINQHIVELDRQITFFRQNMRILRQEIDQNTITILLLKHVNGINKMLNEYELDLNNLIDAILFAKQGIVHPKILTPAQITTSLQHIQSLEPSLQFPTPLKNKYAEELIRISKLDVIYADPNLIYVLTIPLLNEEIFHFYHLLPVPVKQNYDNSGNKFAYIIPNENYIAISIDRSSYIQLTDSDFAHCKLSQDTHICEQHQPVYHTNNHQSCEMMIFLHESPLNLETCNIRISSFNGPYWSKTRVPNTWVYSLTKPETLHITCKKSDSTRVTLTGTGTLHLDNHCKAFSQIITLSTTNSFTSTAEHTYIPEFTLNLTEIYRDLNHNNTVNLSSIPIFHLYKPTLTDADLNTNSVALKDIIKQATEISTHHRDEQNTNYIASSLTYAGIALAVIAILGIAYKFSLFGKIWTVISCFKKTKRRNSRKTLRTYEKPIELEIIHPHCNTEPPSDIPPKIPPQPPKTTEPTVHFIKPRNPPPLPQKHPLANSEALVKYYH
jgi:hypothetical protein